MGLQYGKVLNNGINIYQLNQSCIGFKQHFNSESSGFVISVNHVPVFI